MSKNYKLSVVVLVYNTEPYMRECLDSLVNQTLEDIEIIMVNDESPDDSVAIIEEYQKSYSNIKLINQKNSGGAVAGNNGLQAATGEYVTVMDSDDVVPLDAYEKLYYKAIDTNADIVIGRANLLVDGIIKEVHYKKERDVWKEDREVTDLLQFPDIFYDGFYWNKIYKREFLFKYDCFMPPGMLYADRPMVHKAFLYANKIEIISDVVYLWRKRGETGAKSITQLKSDINNFKDRMESLYFQLGYINDFGKEQITIEFLKRNLDRLFFPIKSIVEDEEFREVYLQEVKDFLAIVPNVYDNDIGIVKNLYIYMILNDMWNELVEFLKTGPKGPIIEEEGTYYWSLPYFRDPDVNIPDEYFQVTVLQSKFVKLDTIDKDDQFIIFKNIYAPDAFQVDQVKIELASRTNPHEKATFEAKRNKKNVLTGKIPYKELDSNQLYDVFVIFYSKEREDRFRITKKMLETKFKKMEFFDGSIARRLFFDGGKLSFLVADIRLEALSLNNNQVSILVKEPNENLDLRFFVKNRGAKEKIYFHTRENGQYELPWNQFIEPNHTYDLFIRVYNKGIRLHLRNLPNYHRQSLVVESGYTELYKTEKDNISLKTSTFFRRKLRKLLGKS
ncbi:glycosyltransferase [Neobacillus cucumis]|uniref:glycosyltransferase n=1 Tax=Neobacillus cucumis TaxID=1740721 RepID=UPI002570614F|nr:glycosyltransferase [Neobacillus cucumis]